MAWTWQGIQKAWEEVAADVGGKFVYIEAPTFSFGGSGNPFFKITTTLDHWTVRLDTFNFGSDGGCLGTRMRACYVSRDAFHFSIHRAGMIAKMADLLGIQDAQTGEPAFDKRYFMRATSEPQLRKLFSSDTVRNLFDAQPWYFNLQARDKDRERPELLPANVDQLLFHNGVICADRKDLLGFFDLFRGVLQQLVRIGSISETDPGIEY